MANDKVYPVYFDAVAGDPDIYTNIIQFPSRAAMRRGDCNDDGAVDIADPVATLFAIFLGEFEITCADACDSNDDETVDISDVIATLGVLFLGNGVIPLPGMNHCGVDPTDAELTCDSFAACEGNR